MLNLIQIVDAAVADAARRSGEHLLCRAGCAHCCVGAFAISQQDAVRLREGLDELARTDTERLERVRARVAASVARLESGFPGDPATGILAEDDDSRAFFDEEFANEEVCPVLDPETATCDLYAARPILCRTFGPPMRDDEGNLAACELCYTGASMAEIAACVVNPDISELEEMSNDAFNAEHGVTGETLVAFALR